ncbi:MAG: ATP synthase subunit I [Pseudomonadota bacterium]|nr:ATP synthase subunit I [Pseudomonadota bacterium]
MSGLQQKPFGIIGWQAALALISSAVLLPVFGLVAAYSALAGGMISVVANAFFALRLFSNKGSWQVNQLAAVTYRGVIGKLFLTVALFLLAVVLLKPLNAAALFAMYLWIQISPALIAGVMNKK